MTHTAPSVGIGILNWNGKKFLETLLPALQQLTYPNFCVYVIDNKSSDDSVAYLRKFHPGINVIELDDNYGFAGGYNKGFALMQQEYLLMMNSDVTVPASFIEPLVDKMESDPRIACCQPKLLSLLQPEKLEHAGAAGGMIDLLGYPFCRGRIFDTVEDDRGQYNHSTEIFWASGACCLIRREAYEKVHGMYHFFFMHSEEIDMCWRLAAEGYKIMYCPGSFIFHLGGGTLTYQSPRKTYLNFRNNMIMCFRNSPWYVNLWLLPVRVLLDLAAAGKFLLNEPKNCRAILLAYQDFFKWLFTAKNKYPPKKKSLLSIHTVLHTSIVWQYYIKNKKRYSEIKG